MPRFLGTASSRAMLGFGVVIAVLFFFGASDQWLTVVNYTMIYAIAVLALNVLSGYTGQVSLGIAFFMGVGAYAATWLGSQPITLPFNDGHGLKDITYYGLDLPIYIWLPGAGIVAALAGALIGPTALRLKGFYLGIVSLALIFIGIHIFKNITLLSRGPEGRNFILSPALGGLLSLNSFEPSFYGQVMLSFNQQFFLLILVVLAVCALFVANVMRTRAGRAFQAVRDHEVGAAIMGINLFRAKMGAFILSSFLAGIAGALNAAYTQYIRPADWSLLLSIQFVAAIIVGGIASVWGSILGAVFVFALPTVIDQLQQGSAPTVSSGDINTAIYGLLIILFLLFEPGGLIGLIHRAQSLAQRFNHRLRKGGEPAETTPSSEFEVEKSALSTGEGTQPLAE